MFFFVFILTNILFINITIQKLSLLFFYGLLLFFYFFLQFFFLFVVYFIFLFLFLFFIFLFKIISAFLAYIYLF